MARAAAMTTSISEPDDLDCAASEYALAAAECAPEQRPSLRDDLIRRLIPFADRLASRYRNSTEPFEDIRQVARLGLVKAVDRYDPDRGSFTAFALVTITGEMKRHFRDRTWAVRVHRGLQELALEVGHATAELTHALSRVPTDAEIARHLGVGEHEVRDAQTCRARRTPMSLNVPMNDDGRHELGDVIAGPDEAVEELADRLAVDDLLRQLPPQIRSMVIMRFYGNLTQSQIAAASGISQMHVSRLLHRALAWLRAGLLSDTPPPWDRVHAYQEPATVKVQIRETGTSIDVELEGVVDVHTADRLSRRLHAAVSLAAAPGRLTVDLTRVIAIDATGAAVLRDAEVSARRARVAVTIVGRPAPGESMAARRVRPPSGTGVDPGAL